MCRRPARTGGALSSLENMLSPIVAPCCKGEYTDLPTRPAPARTFDIKRARARQQEHGNKSNKSMQHTRTYHTLGNEGILD